MAYLAYPQNGKSLESCGQNFGLPQTETYCLPRLILVYGVAEKELGLLLPDATRELKNLGTCSAVLCLQCTDAQKLSD